MEALAVLVADERLGEVQEGQDARLVARIGDAGMMQPRDEVPDPELALGPRSEGEAAAAVDAVGRRPAVPVRHRPVEGQGAGGPGDVATCSSARRVAAVADAVRVSTSGGGEQEAGHLQAAGGEHDVGGHDREPRAAESPDGHALRRGSRPPSCGARCSSR